MTHAALGDPQFDMPGLDSSHCDLIKCIFSNGTYEVDCFRSVDQCSFLLRYDVELYQRIEYLINQKLPLYKTEEQEVMQLMERVTEAQRIAKMVGVSLEPAVTVVEFVEVEGSFKKIISSI